MKKVESRRLLTFIMQFKNKAENACLTKTVFLCTTICCQKLAVKNNEVFHQRWGTWSQSEKIALPVDYWSVLILKSVHPLFPAGFRNFTSKVLQVALWRMFSNSRCPFALQAVSASLLSHQLCTVCCKYFARSEVRVVRVKSCICLNASLQWIFSATKGDSL